VPLLASPSEAEAARPRGRATVAGKSRRFYHVLVSLARAPLQLVGLTEDLDAGDVELGCHLERAEEVRRGGGGGG
jgi:hypothetical protein